MDSALVAAMTGGVASLISPSSIAFSTSTTDAREARVVSTNASKSARVMLASGTASVFGVACVSPADSNTNFDAWKRTADGVEGSRRMCKTHPHARDAPSPRICRSRLSETACLTCVNPNRRDGAWGDKYPASLQARFASPPFEQNASTKAFCCSVRVSAPATLTKRPSGPLRTLPALTAYPPPPAVASSLMPSI